jgi:hypothetical protein
MVVISLDGGHQQRARFAGTGIGQRLAVMLDNGPTTGDGVAERNAACQLLGHPKAQLHAAFGDDVVGERAAAVAEHFLKADHVGGKSLDAATQQHQSLVPGALAVPDVDGQHLEDLMVWLGHGATMRGLGSGSA